MIALEREGAVFVLRMNGGENRVNRAFVADINSALDEIEASEGDAALVTTGEGKFYSNGLDLAGLATAGPEEAGRLLRDLDALLVRLVTFPTATVAAINGHAFAAGAMFACAHDYQVMRADRGFWCLPEIDLRAGQPLTSGMYAVLQSRLEPSTLHEALITGQRYGGEEAAARGLVHEARREDEVLPRAIELASGLAGKDRATMAAIKRGLYAAALKAIG